MTSDSNFQGAAEANGQISFRFLNRDGVFGGSERGRNPYRRGEPRALTLEKTVYFR